MRATDELRQRRHPARRPPPTRAGAGGRQQPSDPSAAARAAPPERTMSRQQRQRRELLSALHSTDLRRAIALVCEHLVEFPEDEPVRMAVAALLADGDRLPPAEVEVMRLLLSSSDDVGQPGR